MNNDNDTPQLPPKQPAEDTRDWFVFAGESRIAGPMTNAEASARCSILQEAAANPDNFVIRRSLLG